MIMSIQWASEKAEIIIFVPYLDREKPCQIDLCNCFGHRFVFYASSFWFELIQLLRWPHQVKHFIIFQQSISYWEGEINKIKLSSNNCCRFPQNGGKVGRRFLTNFKRNAKYLVWNEDKLKETKEALCTWNSFICMFNESGDIVKISQETIERRVGAVLLWASHYSLFLNTYALRGFPGFGRSYAACATLSTEPLWRYLEPATHTQVLC